jgi:hypothetical protein
MRPRRVGVGEVDHDIGGGAQRGEVRQHGGAGGGRARTCRAAGQQRPGGGHFLGQQAAHAAGDAGNADADGHDAPSSRSPQPVLRAPAPVKPGATYGCAPR